MGVGRPKSLDGSLTSEDWGVGCCWSLSGFKPGPETFGLLAAGSSAESTVSGVDLRRWVGDEAAAAVVLPWGAAAAAVVVVAVAVAVGVAVDGEWPF